MTQTTAARAQAIEETLLHGQRLLDHRFFNNRLQICIRVGSLEGSTNSQSADPWGSIGSATDELYYFLQSPVVTIQIPVDLYYEPEEDEITRVGAEAFLKPESGWIGFAGNITITPERIRTENEHLLASVEQFQQASLPATFDSVVRIINFSVDRGYHPVAAVDDDEASLEIEARIDPNRLLLIQVWPSGVVDGVVFGHVGFQSIEATTVNGVLDWLDSGEYPAGSD